MRTRSNPGNSDAGAAVARDTRRLARIETIFAGAVALAGEARSAYLDEFCGDDSGLRRDVERLLTADSRSPEFLSSSALGQGFELQNPEALSDASPTRRIGPYQLVRLLGSGGIGHVWLARRVDEHFEKDVALKLIKRGMDTDEILSRFRQERQVLARLEHPNIARLIDGGATDDGLPYLVMEYVDGVAIDRFCNERRLSVTQRLSLFREVCAAVQYAHQNLVIHRDIKPGNIFVTADGRVKLLDFGIAKVLAAEGEERARGATATRARLMTPEYASPEQIRGESISTAGDVYSLGVVLYELLTRRMPYAEGARSAEDFARVICEVPPTRPSKAVRRTRTPASRAPAARGAGTGAPMPGSRVATIDPADIRRLQRRLAGDLDTILMTALQKAPARRYGSVDQFSEDLRRHLVHLPIAARPPSWTYLAGRFIQRHTAAFVAALVVVATAVASLVITTRAYFRTEAALARERTQRQIADGARAQSDQARRRSEADAEKVRAINSFLQSILVTEDPLGKLRPDIRLRELLDEASRVLDAGALTDQREVEAAIRTTIGRTYVNLKQARLAEPHLRVALSIRRRLLGREHLDAADAAANLAYALCEQGKFDEGIPLYREALEDRRRLTLDDGMAMATLLWGYATALRDTNQGLEAEQAAREALDIVLKLRGPHDVSTAEGIYRLGWILWTVGKLDEAESTLRSALAIQQDLLGPSHAAVGETLQQLGRTFVQKHNLPQAEAALGGGLAILRASLGDEHPRTNRCLGHYGNVLRAEHKYDELEALCCHFANISRPFYGTAEGVLGQVFLVWGRARVERGNRAGAAPLLRQSLAEFRRTLGDAHESTALARFMLGDTLIRLCEFDEAEPLLLEHYAWARGRTQPRQTAERESTAAVFRLYRDWYRAHPSDDLRDKAQKWRKMLREIDRAAASAPSGSRAR